MKTKTTNSCALNPVNIYLLKTSFRNWYVLAEDVNEAQLKLTKFLNDREYSYERDRVIISIELVGLFTEANIFMAGNYALA